MKIQGKMRREVEFKANLADMYLCVGPAFTNS